MVPITAEKDEITDFSLVIGSMTTNKAKQTVLRIANAIVDTVAETGDIGAPATSIYLAMSEHGCTFAQYEAFIGALCDAGKLRRDGGMLFAVN